MRKNRRSAALQPSAFLWGQVQCDTAGRCFYVTSISSNFWFLGGTQGVTVMGCRDLKYCELMAGTGTPLIRSSWFVGLTGQQDSHHERTEVIEHRRWTNETAAPWPAHGVPTFGKAL